MVFVKAPRVGLHLTRNDEREPMSAEFDVVQDHDTGNWNVREEGKVIETFTRLEDAIAYARAALLQTEQGSVVVYTPSDRIRERLSLTSESDGEKSIQAA